MLTSNQNKRIKDLILLQQKSQERRRQSLFVIEGRRELQHCVEGGYEVQTLLYCPSILGINDDDTTALLDALHGLDIHINADAECISVSASVYDKIAYRGGTEGVVATIRAKSRKLSDLNLPQQPLIIVLESVEKPGNLGAILRSADAAHADAVIVCDPLTDLYNPNLIRSSIGAAFSVPVVACCSEDCIDFLKQHGIQILTAQLQDSELYYDTDMRCATAIVMGTEATGLTDMWRKAADAHIRIPMLGKLDSLNVSVSTAILLFEAVRQRQQ